MSARRHSLVWRLLLQESCRFWFFLQNKVVDIGSIGRILLDIERRSPMDPKVVIEKNFDIREFGGVRMAKCKACSKEIVLRAGSLAVTRLVSHVGQHGLLFGEAIPPVTKK